MVQATAIMQSKCNASAGACTSIYKTGLKTSITALSHLLPSIQLPNQTAINTLQYASLSQSAYFQWYVNSFSNLIQLTPPRERLLHFPHRHLPRNRPRHEIQPRRALCPHNRRLKGRWQGHSHLLRKGRRSRNCPRSTLVLWQPLLRNPGCRESCQQTRAKDPRAAYGRHVLCLRRSRC